MVDGLTGGNTVQIENENFFRWTGVDLTSGMDLKIVIRKPLDRLNIMKYAAFGILILFLGAGLIYSSIFNRQNININNRSKILKDWGSERQKLINDIADLDDRFEKKEILEDEYRNLRPQKKNKLISLIQRIYSLNS